MTDQTHPGPARDISLPNWLDGIGFHPADTELKQRGHEAARMLVALLAAHLYQLLPAGREKSLVFTQLEDVLMRANRALALGGGPRAGVQVGALDEIIGDAKRLLGEIGTEVPADPRIAEYEAGQRGETEARNVTGLVERGGQLAPVTFDTTDPRAAGTIEGLASLADQGADSLAPYRYEKQHEGGGSSSLSVELPSADGTVVLAAGSYDEQENVYDSADVEYDDPQALLELASFLVSVANRMPAR